MKRVLLTLLMAIPLIAFSQEAIKGKIVDANGKGVADATVEAIESAQFVVTDAEGNFEIQAKSGEMITITSLDGETNSLPATTDFMTVTLQTALVDKPKEVVVIGYGKAKRRDLAGSIVKVAGKEVADKPNANPVASLQGKVSGLSVVNSGQPGQEPDIRIRGTISRYQTKPLYVIDGIFNDNMNFVNANDIESIEVLKDPSSLAIFGVRGANGVIIVTTKKAKSGKTTVNLSSSVGIKNIVNKPDLATGDEFRMLYAEQLANQGANPYQYMDLYNANTDWVDEIKNDNAMIHMTNVSISHGTDMNRFYFGAGYLSEEGLIRTEKLRKITFNLNDELKLSDKIKFGVGISGYKGQLPKLYNFGSAINAVPIVTPYNEAQGLYNQMPIGLGDAQIANPKLAVDGFEETSLNDEYRFVGNIFGEFTFLKDFTFRTAYTGDLGVNKGRGYTPIYDVYVNETGLLNSYASNTLTSVSQYKNEYQKFQQDYLLTYQKELGKHNITAMAGYTTYYDDYSAISGSVKQYVGGDSIPYDKRWWYLNVFPFGDPETRVSNSEQWDRSTQSYLFRALYSYDGKYILNASFRRDGSSELSPANRWDNFWSVGAAWEVTKEKFMENQKIFDYLKLKGSYGELGNQFSSVHYPYYPNYVGGQGAVFGNENGEKAVIPAYVLAYNANSDLGWERVKSAEVGFELSTLGKRLHLDGAYYDKKTEDLIAFVEFTGGSEYTNAGAIRNKGFEFSATWNDKINDNFEYGFGGNFTTIDNEVISIFEEGYTIFDGNSITRAGDPIGSFYGYEVEGIYQSYADILASPASTLGNYSPGDFKYKDINGDGIISDKDRKIIGNPTPDLIYGFNATMRYKSFDLAVDFNGVYGNEIYRNWGNGSTFAQFNYRADRLGRWTGAGTSNWEPKIDDSSSYNQLPSTYMIEDGSYLRLRNIQLGYTVNPELLGNVVQNLRIYANCQNLYTWSHNSGFTPEAGGTPTSFGVDNSGYPIPRIISFGINATF